MSSLDWGVMLLTIVGTISYGMYKSRGTKDLNSYFLSGKEMKWFTIGLSIIATQASAITFLSTPGQGYGDGMRFAQFYFGVPLAMIILSLVFIPLYHKLKIYTAYEFLERRFDLKTRMLGAGLFLVQRGLAVGLTIYAPSLILSNILGWDIYKLSITIGAIIVAYTVSGGSKAVGYTHKPQMLIILSGMVLATYYLINSFPDNVALSDAVAIASEIGKTDIIDWKFDLSERYNIWSGMLGGLFLALAYFGTDQSQVQRYIGGKSIKHVQRGLLINGIVKVPMQLGILFIGVLLFAYYQFVMPPVFFNPAEQQRVYQSEYGDDYREIEAQHALIFQLKKQKLEEYITAINSDDNDLAQIKMADVTQLMAQADSLKEEAVTIILKNRPGANGNDLDQVFITFITQTLPSGLIGLLIAVILSASMSSASSILNALGATSTIDIYKRLIGTEKNDKKDLFMSKMLTVVWGIIGISFALFANKVGNLIQAVNILGSLFYGSILGIFLVGFFIKRIQGTEVFYSAILAQIVVFLCFLFTNVSYLWFNVIGSLVVVGTSLLLHVLLAIPRRNFQLKTGFK